VVVRPVQAPHALAAFGDQLGVTQHAKVLGDGRARDVTETRGDFARGKFVRPDVFQDLSTAGFRKRSESCVHANMLVLTYVSVN